MSDEDRRLIAECLSGQTQAFGGLVSRYQTRLYNAILRVLGHAEDAADVVQDSFLNAFQSLGSFKGDAEFFTWLYRIAFNSAMSHKRRKRATISLDVARAEGKFDPEDPTDYIKPGSSLARMEEEGQLHKAMSRLSAEHKEVLVLKDIEGLRYEQIADILEVPIGTIRSRLHRARIELHSLLSAE